MSDTTVKKIDAAHAPFGPQGQRYLATGKGVSMRMWRKDPSSHKSTSPGRDYETVGYVVSGRARLEVEGQQLTLEAGDSWLVPANAAHRYEILESFTAVEATAPPAHVEKRDAAPGN